MSRRLVAVVSAAVFVLGSIGGWFIHFAVAKSSYESAWTGYQKEVKAWNDVNERYRALMPVCAELAGEAECGELIQAGERAGNAAQTLALDIKKTGSPSSQKTEKLEKATKDIKVEREKFESAVVAVEKAAEVAVVDKFGAVLEEAEKKAAEASGTLSSLSGQVKDEKTLADLGAAIDNLTSTCEKWKGKEIPVNQQGVKAYVELRRAMLAVDDATAKANESHNQWQAEESQKIFSSLSGSYGFYSGAGAWDTTLELKADGTFVGIYHDTDMGAQCDGCTAGAMYLSEFSGKFSNLTKVNDYEYKATIEKIDLANPVGTEKLVTVDGGYKQMHFYSEPYGLTVDGQRAIGKEVTFYLPGRGTGDFGRICPATGRSLSEWIGIRRQSVGVDTLQKPVFFLSDTCDLFIRE